MASLVGAVYKGTVKSVQSDAGAVYSKIAGQIPTPSRAIYNLGLGIGPLLESIVSELEKKPAQQQQQQSQDSGIAKATAEGFRSLSFQISSLSNIMKDIRSIAVLQLNEQKSTAMRNRQMEVQKKFSEQESIIERGGVSSLSNITTKGAAGKDGLSSAISEAWSTSLKLAGGLALGAMLFKELIAPMLEGIEEQIKKDGPEIAEKLGKSIRDFIWTLVPDFIRKPAEALYKGVEGAVGEKGMSAIQTGGVTALISRLITKNPLLNLAAGVGAGAGEFFLGRDLSLEEQAAFGAGGIGAAGLGGFAAKKMLERRRENRLANRVSDRASESISQRMSDLEMDRYQRSAGPLPTGKIASSAEVPNLKPTRISEINKPSIASNDTKFSQSAYDKAKKYTGKLASLVKKHGASGMFKLVASRMGWKAASAFMASLVGGPLGLVIWVLSAGSLIYDIVDALSDDEKDIKKEGVSSISDPTDTKGFIEPTPMAEAKPGISDTVTAHSSASQFDMERYKRIVMDRESGGDVNAKAKTSSASGLYQFTKGTYNEIRSSDQRFKNVSFEDFAKDRSLQEVAMDILTKRNFTTLKQFLGRDPTEEEMYLAHFMGAKGAIRLMKAAEEGKLVGQSVNSKSIISNPNMFPSVNEKASDALERITGYYSQGKVTKLGKPPTTIGQDIRNMMEGVFTGKDVVEKSGEKSNNLARDVMHALSPFMQMMEGTLELAAASSGKQTSVAPQAPQFADAAPNNTSAAEKDKYLFMLHDRDYYGRAARR
jgi:hypothetical protein